jgi:hypothetical protein
MIKIINTLNVDTVYSSLANITGVLEENIRYYIIRNHFKIIKTDVEEIDIDDFINFLYKNNPSKSINLLFDELTISHLTSRIEKKDLTQEPLYNLFNALINQTEINAFLQDEGIRCIKHENKIFVYYKGKRINWSDFFNGYESGTARMLKNRLEGYSFGGTDKCVNGFLFNGEIYKNPNVDHLKKIPEILENMLRLLGRMDIIDKWCAKSTSYIITFKSNINDIIFDGYEDLTNEQKCLRVIKYCLFFLSKKLINDWAEYHNPIIRLKDELDVEPNQIINVRKVDFPEV